MRKALSVTDVIALQEFCVFVTADGHTVHVVRTEDDDPDNDILGQLHAAELADGYDFIREDDRDRTAVVTYDQDQATIAFVNVEAHLYLCHGMYWVAVTRFLGGLPDEPEET